MKTITIKKATAADAARLNAALAHLADQLGDSYLASADSLIAHGFGDNPVFSALLADDHEYLAGAIVYSPVFSTLRGGPGLYISDLWVSDSHRGAGIGRRLLQAACAEYGPDTRFLKLAVHEANEQAQSFYDRLGFRKIGNEDHMIFDGDAFTAFIERS
jgi:ribosomal protein S18 acetylase RimI-like enzyme